MILLFRRQIILQISKKIFCIRNFKKKIQHESLIQETNRPYFFSKLLDISHIKAKELLEKHPQLLHIDTKDLMKTIDTLKSFNYNTNDIKSKPMLLYLNPLTLQNRYDILKECGCKEPIPIIILSKFLIVMNRSIEILKLHSVIPSELNVQEKLEKCFYDIELKINKKYDDSILLRTIRKEILDEYLRKKLNATDNDLSKIWSIYGRLQHKTYKTVIEMIEILKTKLNFSNERILKNSYVLYGDPDNVKRIINEISTIANEDFKVILHKRPKILMSSCDSILKTIKYIKENDISEIAILKCVDILTLGSDTVKQRLDDLNNVNELRVLKTNPRFLKIVYYLNKAKYRLDYLNQLKIRCSSLNVLSSGTEKFLRFAREGTDRYKMRDTVIYLSQLFQKTPTEMRNQIHRHPNWGLVPIVNLQQCYDFLLSKLFEPNDIYQNIYILLYPIKIINEKLIQLQGQQFYEDYKLNTNYLQLTNSQILCLCIYLIESEYHFTGDGIWTEQSLQPVENFSTILPDLFETFPKTYRHGWKPASQQNKQKIAKTIDGT